ncbi:MAG TPA: hypothetical protein DDZ97_14855 [Deltaproteobacteria bacterium]|nr:hypothetical protein [Deltaproteobacteria bacterium]|tara:strand:- start:11352 stop:12185 length:834 start_codon:yes stop_codon:yes gene_type:complete
MKTLKNSLFLILLWSFFWGCTPTGLRSYIVLTTSKNPQDQREATEELMRLAKEGSIVDQIKAEGHLRQLSQSAIPEQQELAIKPLVWFTFVSDDGYIQERSLARLKGILTHQEWSEAYKLKTIFEVSEFIFGRSGTTEVFENKRYLANADSSERLFAIKFLVDAYPDLSSKLQQDSVGVFSQFLVLEPTIQNCPTEICNPETKTVENPQNKNILGIEDWNIALEQLKLDLWSSLQGLLNESRISGQSRETLLALNKEVIRLSISSKLRNKFLSQPLE